MRQGYWRTLLLRLQHKVAAGENVFFYRQRVLVVVSVNVADHVSLDAGSEVPLAEDALGNVFMLDADTAHVALLDRQTGNRESLDVDFLTFVSALTSLAPPALELGPEVEGWIDFPGIKREVLDDE